MTHAMRPSTLETLGLGPVFDIFTRGGLRPGEVFLAKIPSCRITDLAAGFCVKRGGFGDDFKRLARSGFFDLMAVGHHDQYLRISGKGPISQELRFDPPG